MAVLGATVIAVGIASAAATGAGTAILERVTNLSNLGFRAQMWRALVGAWLSNPVSGLGPGSFPWILQRTSYFQTNSYAPRHPDSVFFQLIGEVGLLGVAAVLVLVVALLPAIVRGRSRGAAWALVVFALAGVAANPTDFAFLVVPAIAWAGFAAPHQSLPGPARDRWGPRGWRVTKTLCLAVIGVAYASTLLGSFWYARAGDAIGEADLQKADITLTSARALDPGLALYAREQGILRYLLGDSKSAISDLTAATSMNPSDALAWRALALALRASQQQQAAISALNHALNDQRSDATNLLLLARWQAEDGEQTPAINTLAEVVQAWPQVVAAPGWGTILPAAATSEQVIDQAVARWTRGDPSPEPFTDQGIWLAVMGNRPDLDNQAISLSGLTPSLAKATLALFRCEPGSASLAGATANDRRTFQYWLLRLRASASTGTIDQHARDIDEAWGAGPLLPANGQSGLNPLDENGALGFSYDVWGYRRPSTHWPVAPIVLPSWQVGRDRWLLDPRGAVAAAGLTDRLLNCQ
jgi:tetratricopeptide (TPR) repeat protein